MSSFEHQFSSDEPAEDVLHEESHWEMSFPHENSGPCHTYNPLHESDTGLFVCIYVVLKDESWDPSLEIFLHDESMLYYSFNLRWDFSLKATTLSKRGISHPRLEGKSFMYT